MEPQARGATKQPRKDSPMGWSGSWKWHPWSRGMSRSRWCQRPSPECWEQSLSPSPTPPRSNPPGEWLCLHMRDLKLQTKTWESHSRVQWIRPSLQLKETEGGQVWHRWWAGWWNHITPRSDSLLGQRRDHWVTQCSYLHYNGAYRYTIA